MLLQPYWVHAGPKLHIILEITHDPENVTKLIFRASALDEFYSLKNSSCINYKV